MRTDYGRLHFLRRFSLALLCGGLLTFEAQAPAQPVIPKPPPKAPVPPRIVPGGAPNPGKAPTPPPSNVPAKPPVAPAPSTPTTIAPSSTKPVDGARINPEEIGA